MEDIHIIIKVTFGIDWIAYILYLETYTTHKYNGLRGFIAIWNGWAIIKNFI